MDGNNKFDAEIDIERFNEYLTQTLLKEKVDFIVYVSTRWQILGAEAKINTYKEQKNGLIIIPEFNDRTGPSDFRTVDDHNVKFTLLRGFSDLDYIESIILQIKQSVGLFKPQMYQQDFDQNNIDVITKISYLRMFSSVFYQKDVIKQYTPKYIIVDPGTERHINRIFLSSIDRADEFVYNAVEKKLMSYTSKLKLEHRYLFVKHNNKLEVNKNVKKEYRSVLPEATGEEGIALLLTSPSSSIGISQTRWTDVISFVSRVLHDIGYDVMIKPHPSEKPDRYQLEVLKEFISIIRTDLSAEEITHEINPEIVVGYQSTALLTLNALYEVPTYTFAPIVIDFVSWRYKYGAKKFLRLTEDLLNDFSTLIAESSFDQRTNSIESWL